VVSRFELRLDKPGIPVISFTVSKDSAGKINITASNLHPNESQEVTFEFRGVKLNRVVPGSAKILTGKSVDAINKFDSLQQIRPATFPSASLNRGNLTLKIPKHSLVVMSLD
jgi:alpha-N-arabinofuranosidase